MMLPFIYTGTRNHDFRVVTSKMLKDVPHAVELVFGEVARAMIDADDSQLAEPSWALVKTDGYILWGMSVLNKVLGDKCLDDDKRPVRGFFGVIAGSSTNKLPYSISFFKELYATYVTPIWDTHEQTEQVSCPLPSISGDEFITKSSLLNNDINVELGKCRIFPYGSDCKGLIEAAFASFEDCSIATNIHKKSRCIEFGKDKLSFMNVVGASDSGIRGTQDIKVYVKETPIKITENPFEDDPKPVEENTCTQCGSLIFGDETLCPECKKKQQNKKLLKYGLYGFITLVCAVLILKGPSIWEAILSPKHTHEFVKHEEVIETSEGQNGDKTDSFLKTRKPEFNIQDANFDQPFEIQYQSSSTIKKVQPTERWIHILTPPNKYSQKGIITFVCEPLNQGERDGQIKLVNEEGNELSITIHQSTTNQVDGGFSVKNRENQNENITPPGLHNVILGERTINNPSSNIKEVKNSETGTSVEGTN